MKKRMIFCLLAIFALGFAQSTFSQKTHNIGGLLGYSHYIKISPAKAYQDISIDASPSVGFFYSLPFPIVTLDLFGGYSSTVGSYYDLNLTTNDEINSEFVTNNFEAALNLRFRISDRGEWHFHPLAGARLSKSFSGEENGTVQNIYALNQLEIPVSGEYEFMAVSPFIGLHAEKEIKNRMYFGVRTEVGLSIIPEYHNQLRLFGGVYIQKQFGQDCDCPSFH